MTFIYVRKKSILSIHELIRKGVHTKQSMNDHTEYLMQIVLNLKGKTVLL